ncbi:MAG: LD-carboxypeptidase [Flavobacteriaceae bacterium]|nr:LD-carboxypeptidase [Flavobacteriaceae bacterium]
MISKKKSKSLAKKSLVSPTKLKKGDTIAIVAPAGILDSSLGYIKKASELIKSWGLNSVLGPNLFSKHNHFAGTDKERLKDLQWALNSHEFKAIWCARGGYGTLRVVDNLNFELFNKYPKWLIGYSDVTVLHSKLHNIGIETIHGMMPVDMRNYASLSKASIKSLKSALFNTPINYEIKANKYNTQGTAVGKIIGGNLSLLVAQLGSNSQLDTKNKILFFEEIGEYKYHIDRMIQSLKRANYFDQCTGLIVGDITKIKNNSPSWGSCVESLIKDALKPYNFPIAFGMPAGHSSENKALILGRKIELSVKNSKTLLNFY